MSVVVTDSEDLKNINKPFHVFAEVLEQGAIDQFVSAMAEPFVVRGALMADCHAGYSLPIGGVVATDGVIVPAWVGYDIGCGMCAVPTTYTEEDVRSNAKKIFDNIYRDIPVGFNHNKNDTYWPESLNLNRSEAAENIFAKNGLKQLCSLGGGNHFIEIGVDEFRVVWIVIHSGSRGIGHAVATHYMKLASGDGKAREGHFGFDVESKDGKDYITDLDFCLEFALANRMNMIYRVIDVVDRYCKGAAVGSSLINRNHNHAELKDGLWIHRKGATHADAGMMGVIPGNMKDGSFIVRGLGNPDSLWSSSHGAGRVMGRKEAKRVLNIDDFKKSMEGITALVNKDTLDESIFAYKDIYDVMRLQAGLVEVVAHPRPIINIKALGDC